MNNAKWWARSRIIILNAIAALAACIVYQACLCQIKQLVPQHAYGWLALAVSLTTIYLRAQTSKPVTRRKRAARRMTRIVGAQHEQGDF